MGYANDGDGRPGIIFKHRFSGVFNYNRIFRLHRQIVHPGKNAENGFPGPGFNPLGSILEQGNVPAKPVDDKTGDPVLAIRGQTGQRADELAENAPPVNVTDQNHRCPGIFGHSEIDDIMRHEIDFRAGPGPFQNNQIIRFPKPVKGLARS